MSLSIKKAIVFHGFLGSSQDFESLNQEYQVFSIDLRPQKNPSADIETTNIANFSDKAEQKNKNNISENFESWSHLLSRVYIQLEKLMGSFSEQDEIVILSYSMGSKVLFSIMDQVFKLIPNFEFNKKVKFVFLSTHFGLYESKEELETELGHRSEMNRKFLDFLNLIGKDEFIQKWNALDLFSKDQKILTDWSEEQIKHYFKFWNLSQTESLLTALERIPKAFVFYGSEDLKYKTQALRLHASINSNASTSISIHQLQPRSHRLLENSDFDFILKVIND